MGEFVLREFVCKHCGHKVVVNPKLPPDANPNCCTPCWEKIVKPGIGRHMDDLMTDMGQFLSALTDPDEDRGSRDLGALRERMQTKVGAK